MTTTVATVGIFMRQDRHDAVQQGRRLLHVVMATGKRKERIGGGMNESDPLGHSVRQEDLLCRPKHALVDLARYNLDLPWERVVCRPSHVHAVEEL